MHIKYLDIGLVVPSTDAISESYRRWNMWDDVEDLQLEKAKEQDRIKSLQEKKNFESSFGLPTPSILRNLLSEITTEIDC